MQAEKMYVEDGSCESSRDSESLMNLCAMLHVDKLTSDLFGHGGGSGSYKRGKGERDVFRSLHQLFYYSTVPEGGGMTTLLDS
jgi:hypothetical protein